MVCFVLCTLQRHCFYYQHWSYTGTGYAPYGTTTSSPFVNLPAGLSTGAVMSLLIIAYVCYSYSEVAHNSMLPDAARPPRQTLRLEESTTA